MASRGFQWHGNILSSYLSNFISGVLLSFSFFFCAVMANISQHLLTRQKQKAYSGKKLQQKRLSLSRLTWAWMSKREKAMSCSFIHEWNRGKPCQERKKRTAYCESRIFSKLQNKDGSLISWKSCRVQLIRLDESWLLRSEGNAISCIRVKDFPANTITANV